MPRAYSARVAEERATMSSHIAAKGTSDSHANGTTVDGPAANGTTTATVLAQAMVREGLRQVAAGANPMELKRGIEGAVDAAVKAIVDQARDIETTEEIAHVASISANNDTSIGEVIADETAAERVEHPHR